MKFVYGGTIFVMLAMAIFGALGVTHGMEHGTGCFAATAAGVPCMADIAESVNMHFSTLRAFSLAVFAASFALVFFIVFARLLRASVVLDYPREAVSRELPTSNYKLQTLLPWLSLFEHSPSLI